MNRTTLTSRLLAGAFSFLALSAVGYADDTDVYLKANTAADQRPNILIVFDNSGSMGTVVTGSGVAYNSSVTYTGNFVDSKLYWSTSGVPTNNATGYSQSFDKPNNRCASSLSPLTTGGRYQGDNVGRWDAAKKLWVNLAANINPLYVDCQKDVIDSNKDTDNKGYPKNGNTGPYSGANDTNVLKNINKPTLYTANWLNWYYTPGSQDQTRLQIAKDVVKGIVDSTVNVRFGLMVFNGNSNTDNGPHGGRVVSNIRDMNDTNKTVLKSTIDSLTASTWTPLSETLWEAYSYFSGKNVDYGDDMTSPTPARDTAAESGGKYISPFSNNVCQQAYIIYMTDGLPTKDKNADDKIKALVNDDKTPLVCSVDYPAINNDPEQGGLCMDDLAGYMYNNDIYAGSKGIQRVSTFTIGFQVDTGILALTAQKGHGEYYTANTAAGLIAAFQAAISKILSTNTSFAAPSLSVNAFNRLFNRKSAYFSLFKPESTARWNGNIKKFGIENCTGASVLAGDGCTVCTQTHIDAGTCKFGKIVDKNKVVAVDPATKRFKADICSEWSTCPPDDGSEVTLGGAGGMVPARADRPLFTYTGAQTPTNVNLNVDAHKLLDSNSKLTFEMLGLIPSATGDPDADKAADEAARTARIEWIRGQDLTDENNNGVTDEDRWKIGDVLHSRPLAVTYGGTKDNPTIKLFVGSNDGSLRMIDESTGVEEWSFIPQELLKPLQGKLFDDSSTGVPPHFSGLDGTPTAWVNDADLDGVIEPDKGEFVRVFIGMRRGGSNIYALDVTPSSSCSLPSKICPTLMWVIKGGEANTDFAKLGQTWSAPSVTRIRLGQAVAEGSKAETALIFGGGYYAAGQDNGAWGPDDTDGKGIGTGNAIFIVDPTDGSRIWWASRTGSGADLELANMSFSIPSDVALLDSNGDGETDRLYVGDTGAQLWRIDLDESLKKNSNGSTSGARLAVVADADPATKTDNRKFFYPPDVAQVTDPTFSSVADYDMITIGSGDREAPLSLEVQDRLFAFRDTLIKGKIPSTFKTLTSADLFDATSNLIQDGSDAQKATLTDELKLAKGWYVNLIKGSSLVGEKALAASVILNNSVFYTTYLPAVAGDTGTCEPQEGKGRLYVLNLLTAAAAQEQTSDTTLNVNDRYGEVGGGIPPEYVPVVQETGITGLVGPVDHDPDVPLPRIKTYWYQ